VIGISKEEWKKKNEIIKKKGCNWSITKKSKEALSKVVPLGALWKMLHLYHKPKRGDKRTIVRGCFLEKPKKPGGAMQSPCKDQREKGVGAQDTGLELRAGGCESIVLVGPGKDRGESL